MARTIRQAAQAGVVGASIEDVTGRADAPFYDIGFAAERIRAAVEAARALPIPFTLTARAENFFLGKRDRQTRSPGCRHSRKPAPTCSMHRA